MTQVNRLAPKVVGTLAVLAVLGAVNLPFPFNGDQALFCVGAKQLADGAALYRDFWDLKQPGIYWFYLAAGRLFGFSEVGVHSLELLCFLALAAIMLVTLPRWLEGFAGAAVATALSVGVYFAVAGTWHLSQIEGVVAMPLYGSLWLMLAPGGGRSVGRRAFAAGLLAGVVASLKLMYAVIPAVCLVLAIVRMARSGTTAKVWVKTAAAPFIAGGLVVAAAVVGDLALHGTLAEAWRTNFVYPPRILKETPGNGVGVLIDGARWFVRVNLLTLPLAIVGAAARLWRRDAFAAGLVCWVVVGLVAVLAQRMWWQYHFLLLLVPVGILAAAGVESLAGVGARQANASSLARKSVFAALFMLAALAPAGRWMKKAVAEVRTRAWTTDGRVAFSEEISPTYTAAAAEVAAMHLRDDVTARVYVLGDPLILQLADKPQPIPIHGWSPEWMLPEQWREMADGLNTRRPDFVFVAASNRALLSSRGAAVGDAIASGYHAVRDSDAGTWYRHN